jgi:transketolase
MAFSDRTLERFDSYGWHTAARRGRQRRRRHRGRDRGGAADERPSLIAVRTHIGFGAPTKHDSQKPTARRSGEEEVRGAKLAYGWDPDKHFFVPDEALALYREAVPAGEKLVAEWHDKLARYAAAYPGRGRRARSGGWPAAARRLGPRSQDLRRGRRTGDPKGQPGGDQQSLAGRCRSSSAARRTCPSRT